jgi:DNA-binding beta-propeller fold protein YncE
VTRFLGGGFRGVACRVIPTPGVKSFGNGVAVSVDGSTLLVADHEGRARPVTAISLTDGALRRGVGGVGYGRLHFKRPCQVWVAGDGFVFVADGGNNRVQVLTPTLDFHGFVGVGQLRNPAGVCANADVVVASELDADRISVFNRSDGALLRRIGSYGSGDGELRWPRGLCFTDADRRIAVAESWNNRVSVFSVDGDFIRHVGVGVLNMPLGVAVSTFDELVVADSNSIRVFSSIGDALTEVTCDRPGGVVMHGDMVLVQSLDEMCTFFR